MGEGRYRNCRNQSDIGRCELPALIVFSNQLRANQKRPPLTPIQFSEDLARDFILASIRHGA